ncbi:hypothetical protein [Aestuariivirga sp.]|uniref:hypothetical protein n=1 Tax=Aestuariivirga sp. TaxID=2650926 RepID=UPI0039E38014
MADTVKNTPYRAPLLRRLRPLFFLSPTLIILLSITLFPLLYSLYLASHTVILTNPMLSGWSLGDNLKEVFEFGRLLAVAAHNAISRGGGGDSRICAWSSAGFDFLSQLPWARFSVSALSHADDADTRGRGNDLAFSFQR